MTKGFFDYYPNNTFNLLTGENKRLYLDIIILLYKDFFDETSDYEEISFSSFKIRSKIKEELYKRASWFDEDTQEMICVNDGVDIDAHTSRVYLRLIECGWIKVDRQGHKDHVFMLPRIIELIEFLVSAGKNMSSDVGGSVFSIYQTLNVIRHQQVTDTDISVGLTKAVEDSRLIARRMNRLSSHIRGVSEKISEIGGANEKVDLFFESFIKESSFSDYKDIKSENHPFRFKSVILDFLRDFEFDGSLKDRLIKAVAKTKSIPREEANEQLMEILSKMRKIFVNTDNLLERIDLSHGKLVRRVTESVQYQKRNISGGCYREALELIKNKDCIESLDVANSLPQVFSISEDCLYKPKKKREKIARGTVVKNHISNEGRLLNKEIRAYQDSISIRDEDLCSWVADKLGSNDSMRSVDIDIVTAPDFFAFVQARRLCGQYREGFHATRRNYMFTLNGEELVDHLALFSAEFTIEKSYNKDRNV